MACVLAVQWSCPTPALAGLDNQINIVDEQGRTLQIQQWDTELRAVHPIDRNRLTREWFHSGRAVYQVSGQAADEFEGQLMLGYQVGFPWSMGVGINFSYTTPNALLDGTPINPLLPTFSPLSYVITPNLFPGLSMVADLGNGPGVVEVTTFLATVAGAQGDILVSDAHGTVSGAAGGVLLRPFARVVSNDGATATTYGEPWNVN